MKVTLDFKLWKRQLQCLKSPATEILFGGATEGGKSHLARIALISWCLAIPNFQCVLIRKKFDSIAKNHVEGPTGFKQLLAPLIQAGEVKILEKGVRFPNGSNIDFEHCQDERQFDKAQGIEKHAIVIDEATQISERLIRFFRGWCRMTPEQQEAIPDNFKGMFPRILYTANPIGASVGYFRRNFVKARPAFEIEEVDGFLRQYIPSRATDNKSVDLKAHHGRLAGIGDEALAKALDEGDWDAPVGDFIREYDEARHVVPDFIPPDWWFKYRAFDWGHAEPFAVGWFCVSDGEEFEYQGKKFWFPVGAIIQYREWYGCKPDDGAIGLRLSNKEIARGILARTPELVSGITLADSKPFQANGGILTAQEFFDGGVPLILADTKRISGWSNLKNKLKGDDGYAMFYICESCKYTREYLPSLQRHATKMEDAVESGEATHIADMVRYALNAKPSVRVQPDPEVNIIEPNRITFNDALEISNRSKEAEHDW
jgi:hypothetical protein